MSRKTHAEAVEPAREGQYRVSRTESGEVPVLYAGRGTACRAPAAPK